MINATAGTDTNHDGLPDQWEQELVYWSFGALTNISQMNPQDDFDGDGQSNLAEYLAGTFAFLNYDYFYAEDYGMTTNGRFRITFLSVPGKIYGARYVTDTGLSRWTPSPIAVSDTADFQTTPIEGNGDWLSIYVPGDLAQRLLPTDGGKLRFVSAVGYEFCHLACGQRQGGQRSLSGQPISIGRQRWHQLRALDETGR